MSGDPKEPRPVDAELKAAEHGFCTRAGAPALDRDLRDALIALESPEYLQSDCAGSLRRPLLEACGWLIAGVALWVVLIILFS
ncbi:MAG: hypothetical protein JSR67_10955 [Proteobacteria bacterium]|nr:hypothetical protein [Pseudomonadota bacterium]